MGPCPTCSRHVFLSEGACPFCGASWTLTRRGFGIAAVAATAALLAPRADAAVKPSDQEAKYGIARPRPDPAAEQILIWDRLYGGWMTEFGLLSPGKNWSGRKPGTLVSFTGTSSGGAGRPASTAVAYRLAKRADSGVSIDIEFFGAKSVERTLTCADGVAKDAKVTETGKETIDVDGRKVECDVKSYELPGRTFKICWNKDLPFGFARCSSGEETTTLLKSKETVEIASKKYECSTWETKRGETTIKTWRCADFPGTVVRLEETVKGGATVKIEASSLTDGK